MSLISYIEKLRGRPEAERKRAALGFTIGVTLLIFIIWLFTTASRLSLNPPTPAPASPGIYASLKDSWNSLVESASSIFSRLAPADPIATTTDAAPTAFDGLEGIPADVLPDATGTPIEVSK